MAVAEAMATADKDILVEAKAVEVVREAKLVVLAEMAPLAMASYVALLLQS